LSSYGFAKKFKETVSRRMYSAFFLFLVVFVFLRGWVEKQAGLFEKSLFASNSAAFFLCVAFFVALFLAGILDKGVEGILFVRKFFPKSVQRLTSTTYRIISGVK